MSWPSRAKTVGSATVALRSVSSCSRRKDAAASRSDGSVASKTAVRACANPARSNTCGTVGASSTASNPSSSDTPGKRRASQHVHESERGGRVTLARAPAGSVAPGHISCRTSPCDGCLWVPLQGAMADVRNHEHRERNQDANSLAGHALNRHVRPDRADEVDCVTVSDAARPGQRAAPERSLSGPAITCENNSARFAPALEQL